MGEILFYTVQDTIPCGPYNPNSTIDCEKRIQLKFGAYSIEFNHLIITRFNCTLIRKKIKTKNEERRRKEEKHTRTKARERKTKRADTICLAWSWSFCAIVWRDLLLNRCNTSLLTQTCTCIYDRTHELIVNKIVLKNNWQCAVSQALDTGPNSDQQWSVPKADT